MRIFDNIFGREKGSGQTSSTNQNHNVPDFDEFREFSYIPSIYRYTLIPDFTIAEKAANAVHRLFEKGLVLKKNELYKTFRYLQITKADIAKFKRFEKDVELTLLCIASMNGNGYSREAALNRMVKLRGQRAIPFVIFRLADWVIPIRKKAEKAIQKFLIEENTIPFIHNYKLINWLIYVKRNNLSEYYNQILQSITSKQLSKEQLQQLNEGERFFYFKSFLRLRTIDDDLLNKMLSDHYYLIRILLIKHLDGADSKSSVLLKLLSDKSQKVRQGAITLLDNQNLNEFKIILEKLIFDNSLTVRAESRRLLSKLSDYSFEDIYKESLSKQQFVIGSLYGLSEVSSANEIPLLENYLQLKKAKIKIAALIGIYNLDTDIGTEKAYQILETENPISTRRAAETILSKQGIDRERLRKLYDYTDLAGRKIVLRLFNKFTSWSTAGDFLKAFMDSEKEIQLKSRLYLQSWCEYTINLAIEKRQEEIDYVLNWYYEAQGKGIEVPSYILDILGEK